MITKTKFSTVSRLDLEREIEFYEKYGYKVETIRQQRFLETAGYYCTMTKIIETKEIKK